jgi:hypothetical protein
LDFGRQSALLKGLASLRRLAIGAQEAILPHNAASPLQ